MSTRKQQIVSKAQKKETGRGSAMVQGQLDGKPAWANQIEALFTGAGYTSQEKFARAIGMKRGRMGHIVAGYNEPIEAMSYEERVRMLRVLSLSSEEFERRVKMPLFHRDVPPPADVTEQVQGFEVKRNQMLEFPVLGLVSAGEGEGFEEESTGKTQRIDPEDLRGSNAANIRVYRVNGSCMVSEGVRRAGKNVADGDKIAVDVDQIMLQKGDMVVIWDGVNEEMIVKFYGEIGDGEYITFYPARRGLSPVVRRIDDPIKPLGRVVWRGGRV